jgi:hypothetical protein
MTETDGPMNPTPSRVDRWEHVDLGAATTTTIWSDDNCDLLTRTIHAHRRTQETSVRIEHGSELGRLIAALQRARDRHGRGD